MLLSNKVWIVFTIFLLSGVFLEVFILVNDRVIWSVPSNPPFRTTSTSTPGILNGSVAQSISRRQSSEDFGERLSLERSRSHSTHRSHNFSHVLHGSNVAPLVQAWRQASLDWHTLIPKHLSQWQRYGQPAQEGKARLLVSKEEQVTDYLTMFHSSGLAAYYGLESGPLTNYSACDSISDPCLIHTKSQCDLNGFCEWDANGRLCRDKTSFSRQHTYSAANNERCANPIRLPEQKNPTGCEYYVHEPVVMVRLDREAQTMFYHWWSAWQSLYTFWSTDLHRSKNVHFILEDILDPMFFHYFGLLSNFCWRRADLPLTTAAASKLCFCDVKYTRAVQSRVDHKGSADYMVQALGLEHIKPSASKAKIGLVSRRRKRFLLNEYELVHVAQSLGYECVLLPLEKMTLYEQVRELRSLDVLVGVHGSALDNAVFLPDRAVLVQLLPYKVRHRATFVKDTELANAVYMEWQATDPKLSVFHWDLLEEANPARYKDKPYDKEEVLRLGDPMGGTETLMFWINQDIVVPVDEWKELLVRAVSQSPASNRTRS
eukprot:gene25247-30489_t